MTNAPCPQPHKRGYDRKSRALLAADKLAKRFQTHPYECCCGRWHLTSQGER